MRIVPCVYSMFRRAARCGVSESYSTPCGEKGRCLRCGLCHYDNMVRSELVTSSNGVARPLILQADHLVLRTAVPADVLTRQVDGFERHRQVVVEVVTDAQVDLVVRLDVARVTGATAGWPTSGTRRASCRPDGPLKPNFSYISTAFAESLRPSRANWLTFGCAAVVERRRRRSRSCSSPGRRSRCRRRSTDRRLPSRGSSPLPGSTAVDVEHVQRIFRSRPSIVVEQCQCSADRPMPRRSAGRG